METMIINYNELSYQLKKMTNPNEAKKLIQTVSNYGYGAVQPYEIEENLANEYGCIKCIKCNTYHSLNGKCKTCQK